MKDRLLRALADMENLRERSARQIDSNKQYAVQVRPPFAAQLPVPLLPLALCVPAGSSVMSWI